MMSGDLSCRMHAASTSALHRYQLVPRSTCHLSALFYLTTPRPQRAPLFPTRRSSDLGGTGRSRSTRSSSRTPALPPPAMLDRKSTRLNSSHANISYAVFCLKKKKMKDWQFNLKMEEASATADRDLPVPDAVVSLLEHC